MSKRICEDFVRFTCQGVENIFETKGIEGKKKRRIVHREETLNSFTTILIQMKGKMGGSRSPFALMGVLLVVVLLIPTGGIMIFRQVEAPPVQLDLTLTLQSTSSNLNYRAAYRWTGDGIDTDGGSTSVEWNDKTASASVSSSGELTQAIQSYFEAVVISFDYMVLNESGEWSLDVTKDLCSGIGLGVEITGDESGVNNIEPYLIVSFVPSTLKSALNSVGVDEARIDVKISFLIKGSILEEAALSFGILMNIYQDFISNVVETTVGTISSITG